MYATAALGTEDLLAGELRTLGFANVKRGQGGVDFDAPPGGELVAGMKACLHLRTALRVLWPLATFRCPDGDALYEGAKHAPWERFLTTKSTFAVSATTGAAPPLAHGPFIGQRVKDAVVDRLRDHFGARPDVSRDDPDVRIYVHTGPAARGKGGVPSGVVGLDLAGDSLHQRGYRAQAGEAPLRETLAAAVLLASGWNPELRPLVDPMCGSGTIAIEAALMALRIAPGRAAPRRAPFGFQRWPSFGDAERAQWDALVAEADAQVLPRAPQPIFASDHDPDAIAMARRNAAGAAAGVSGAITFRTADARTIGPTTPPAAIVSNPPYGERIGGEGGAGPLEGFWRALGAHLRTLDGHTAFLLGSPAMIRAFGMRPTWERKLRNGPISVSLCRYELGRGGRAGAGEKPRRR